MLVRINIVFNILLEYIKNYLNHKYKYKDIKRESYLFE